MLVALVGLALAGEAGIGLDFVTPAEITVPVSPLGPAPDRFPIRGPFRLAGAVDGVRTYEARHPVRPRSLFYERQPTGMDLFKGDRHLTYDADPATRGFAGTWEVNASSVMVRVRSEAPRPESGDFELRYPLATEREEGLRFRGGDAAAWAFRSAQVDDVNRHGVLLAGLASVGWDVDVTAGAHLRFEAGILPPEVDEGVRSDGATVEVRAGDSVLATVSVGVTGFEPVDVALPTAGRTRLRLVVTSPDPAYDYVFVASPTVYVPSETPKKVILAFIDTLRRDHLPTYGYERDSAPKLEQWAEEAVVFDDARTVAPWTLPSTRALWTGRHPELYGQSRTLQEVLRERGWATGAYVGNVYLSSNFDMERGWGEHGCLNWPGAAFETWRARDFLRRHRDEDALLLVHFMDLHLPYKEPRRYRRLWADEGPRGLQTMFNRSMLMQVAVHQRELLRPYLVARYDQNLRYVDDELSALLAEVGDDATVVIFADHGEEFFEHGDLEHGHTLYDELLRVPLIVKSPGLAARRVTQPVTLLDVAPTVLELLGVPLSELTESPNGASLVKAAREGADPALEGRSFAIGRALYGGVQWGSVAGNRKYITTRGREELYDLTTDAGEETNLARRGTSPDEARRALAESLGRDVVLALRVSVTGRPNKPVQVDVQVPGGLAHAWVGDDPTSITKANVLGVHGELVQIEFESRLRENREVFLVPKLAAEDLVDQVGVRIEGRMSRFEMLRPIPYDGDGDELSSTRSGSVSVSVTWAILPLPIGEELVGADGELAGALEALGYTTAASPASPPEPKEDDEADERDEPPPGQGRGSE